MDGLGGRRLYAHATTASHLYQALLRSELTRRLGLECTPVVNGIAEVQGVSPQVLRAFSRRRPDIEPRWPSVAPPAQVRCVDPKRLFEEWRERAEGLGWSAELPARRSAAFDGEAAESGIAVCRVGQAGAGT